VKNLVVALSFLPCAPLAAWAQNVTPGQASGHIGEQTTICGIVDSVTSSAVLPGRPTYLNFGQAYPNQDFRVIIFGNQRDAAGPDDLVGKQVCVTGSVSGFNGKAEMYLKTADQLKREPKQEKPPPKPPAAAGGVTAPSKPASVSP
jgi:predicted extracellular nuclease